MSALTENKKTMDLLIKDLDEHSLIDIMDVIQQYELKYSFDRKESTADNNDFRFQDIMKDIIQKNNTLSESMQSLVEEFTDRISDYTLQPRTTKNSKRLDEYEKLLDKCDEIQYIK
jgi:hypothetical protein